MPSGISPPSEFSGMDRSRSSPENPPNMPSGPCVPASSLVITRRATGSNQSHQSPQADSSDSMDVGRGRRRTQPGPNPSGSHRQGVPIDLNATQASFLAGAAVNQAHHASVIADNAVTAALNATVETQHAQEMARAIHAGAMQQRAQFT